MNSEGMRPSDAAADRMALQKGPLVDGSERGSPLIIHNVCQTLRSSRTPAKLFSHFSLSEEKH